MTVSELIDKLKEMPGDADVYAEGEMADKVIEEKCWHEDGSEGSIVRIFKAWNVEFVTGADLYQSIDICEKRKHIVIPKEET